LDHLLSTPRQYGWNWDAHVTTNSNQPNANTAVDALLKDPAVEDVAVVDTPPVLLDNKIRFELLGLDQKKGLLEPVLIDGHVPRAPDEIALGVKTMREAHARIGSTVRISISAIEGGSAPFKVVGTVVIPPNSDTAHLGTGGVMVYEGERRMVPPNFKIPESTDLYFRLASGVNKKQALAQISKATLSDGHIFGDEYQTIFPQRPTDLINFGQVQNLPLLLAGLVAVLAAATLAHTLVTSIRRRRRDLAILKMLGFVPAQVRWAVAWQATTFVAAALLVGLPVGIAVGRVIWSAFASQLGTLAEPVTPSLRLLLTIPAAVVLANMIAVVPAVMAGRMKPAPALRAE
jgi:ABC-type lipoprotein release transport system permease subunit